MNLKCNLSCKITSIKDKTRSSWFKFWSRYTFQFLNKNYWCIENLMLIRFPNQILNPLLFYFRYTKISSCNNNEKKKKLIKDLILIKLDELLILKKTLYKSEFKKTVGLNLRILDMCKLQQNQLYMYKQTLKYLYNFWS